MSITRGMVACLCLGAVIIAFSHPLSVGAQTTGEPEEFTAVAIVNNNLASGAGTVLMDELSDMKPVGTIRTPDSLAYDLRYAHQRPGEDGGRQIVLATDRPIGFWEAAHQPRTIQYPFTVIQMQIGADGHGKGTLSYATKITAHGNTIELENFATQPVMLTDIKAEKSKH
jgi:hypothetical protein